MSYNPFITKINIEVSLGELVDKITILEVKRENIKDQEKLKHVIGELSVLSFILSSTQEFDGTRMNYIEVPDVLRNDLYQVNSDLWDVQDAQRKLANAGDFGEAYMGFSKLIFVLNDRRFELKHAISDILENSDQPLEQKEYV